VEEILGLPELYQQLTHLFEIKHFESTQIADKALEVEQLFKSICTWALESEAEKNQSEAKSRQKSRMRRMSEFI